jgi:hypothetical protein
LNLIQEDRRVFCKYDRFCKHGPGQTRFTDWPADDVAADLFGRLRDLDHKLDRR